VSQSPTGFSKKMKGFFGYKLKGNGVSLGNLVFLKVANSGYKCQIVVRVLAATIILFEKFWLLTIFIKEIQATFH
jgi:hypothetical protein